MVMTAKSKKTSSKAKPKASKKGTGKKSLNLALQGGGSHGAYTWGVLNRLVEEDSIEIEAISGTSAGAMNAAVFADGLIKNGKKGAKEALEKFWTAISFASKASPVQHNPLDALFERWNANNSPAYIMFDMMTRLLSPYQFNPFNFNPLRTVLESNIDFEIIQKNSPIKLFISATNINRGTVRIFTHDSISIEVLLASACLPYLFQAVEIDGEHYWDGGYMGNPSLFPLIYKCTSRDVMLVKINPIGYHGVPMNSADIIDRLNEINFNSSLVGEMRAIHFVKKLIDQHKIDDSEYKDMLIHMIQADELMEDLGVASKLNADWKFLTYLRDIGWNAADTWLKKHYKDLGKQSTVNLVEEFHLRSTKIE